MLAGNKAGFLLLAIALVAANTLLAGTIGFDLKEPVVSEAIELLEAGRSGEAVKKLEDADQSARGDAGRRHAIQLGQAILDIRRGEQAAARKILAPLAKLEDEADIAYAAEALQVISQRAEKKRGSKENRALIAGDAWAELLRECFDSFAKECEKADDTLVQSCKNRQFQLVENQLQQSCDARERALVIQTDELTQARTDFAQAHHARLSRAIEAANVKIAERKNDAKTAGKDIKKRRRYSDERKQAKKDNIEARHEARDATEIVDLIVQERDDIELRFGLKNAKGRKSGK
ncbi:MAG: hypothetical protein JNG88_06040 [Phycisphaerales bacterium]|nr:hypothetical protein [Phycisphaerales bacterium]